MSAMTADQRFCFGANCTWFGRIDEVGSRFGVPACPVCGGVLFEMDTEADWWTGVDKFQADGHPGYRGMLEWQRTNKKCFRLIGIDGALPLAYAYKRATGIEVKL